MSQQIINPAKWILSIQSHVVYGHAGNASAVFPLQRLGFEVAAIHTVQFSNHTGYGDWKGAIFPPSLIKECVQGLKDRDVLKDMQAMVSGYLGAKETALTIASVAKEVKAANSSAFYCADPVMGDFGRGVYVNPELPDIIKSDVIPYADIITPNHFEAQLLSDIEITSLSKAKDACKKLMDMGPKYVFISSLEISQNDDLIECLVAYDDSFWLFSAPKVPLSKNPVGTGDAFTALICGYLLKGIPAQKALQLTAAGLWEMLNYSLKCNSKEIQTIAAQDLLINPSNLFTLREV